MGTERHHNCRCELVEVDTGELARGQLAQIKDFAEYFITCEPGDCADCDVLRHIVELATGRLHRNIGG